jgi:hypothetical protein
MWQSVSGNGSGTDCVCDTGIEREIGTWSVRGTGRPNVQESVSDLFCEKERESKMHVAACPPLGIRAEEND